MNKKAIAILGAIFILIVGTLGFLIYSRSSGGNGNNTPAPTPTPTPTLITTATPTPTPSPTLVSGGKFYKLSGEQVVSPTLTFDGSGIAYFTKQGLLYRSTFTSGTNPLQFGETKQLALEPKTGVSKVLWPTNSQNFMLVYDNGAKKTYEFYNNDAATFTTLPSQVYSLSFLPAGNKIFYVWTSQTGNDTVNVADPDTNNYKTVSEIWDKNAIVYVSPDGSDVAYHMDPSQNNTASNPLVLTDTDGKAWHKVTDGFVSGVLWSPDGKKLLFGKKDPSTQAYQLWYYDIFGGEIKNLGVNTTPDKAVWGSDGQSIYAAVPGTSQGSGGLSLDTFYRVNLQTGERVPYDSGTMQMDGRDLFLSKDGSKLFFRNAQDGGLYYLDLN